MPDHGWDGPPKPAQEPPARSWPIVKLEPVSRDGFGFWDGHDGEGNPTGGVAADLPCYAPSPPGLVLRELRCALRLSLGEAARRLGLTVVELSGLERGSHTLSEDAAWRDLAVALSDREIRPAFSSEST